MYRDERRTFCATISNTIMIYRESCGDIQYHMSEYYVVSAGVVPQAIAHSSWWMTTIWRDDMERVRNDDLPNNNKCGPTNPSGLVDKNRLFVHIVAGCSTTRPRRLHTERVSIDSSIIDGTQKGNYQCNSSTKHIGWPLNPKAFARFPTIAAPLACAFVQNERWVIKCMGMHKRNAWQIPCRDVGGWMFWVRAPALSQHRQTASPAAGSHAYARVDVDLCAGSHLSLFGQSNCESLPTYMNKNCSSPECADRFFRIILSYFHRGFCIFAL